jgi:hypothetical protein
VLCNMACKTEVGLSVVPKEVHEQRMSMPPSGGTIILRNVACGNARKTEVGLSARPKEAHETSGCLWNHSHIFG